MSLLVSQLAPSLSWLLGPMTVLFMLIFLGWVVWTWAPRNRGRLEGFADMALDDTDVDGALASSGRALGPPPQPSRTTDTPLPPANHEPNGGPA